MVIFEIHPSHSIMHEFKTKPELISYRQLRLIVGLTGFFLPVILIIGNCIHKKKLILESSISYYYYSCMRDVFIGLLCTVGIFLFTYKGHKKEKGDLLSDSQAGNLACLFALGLAFFPTNEIEDQQSLSSWIHYISAGLFFTTLAYFSLFKFTKTKGELTEMKRTRNKVYRICGSIIFSCIGMLLLYNVPFIKEVLKHTHYFLYLEIIALWAFAFSWLVKSEIILGDKETMKDDLIEEL